MKIHDNENKSEDNTFKHAILDITLLAFFGPLAILPTNLLSLPSPAVEATMA